MFPQTHTTTTETTTRTTTPIPAQIVQAIREWKAARDEAAPHKAAAALATRLDNKERKARYAVGELLGESTAIEVDGEIVTYERGTRGGNDPDYKAAWDLLLKELDPAWQKFAVEVLADCRTEAAVTHKITCTPATVEAPVSVEMAPPPARGRTRAHRAPDLQ